MKKLFLLWGLFALGTLQSALGEAGLVIADEGKTSAVICIAPDQNRKGSYDLKAAEELARCIEQMSGARPSIAATADTVREALASKAPTFVIGELVFETRPEFRKALAAVVPPRRVFDPDAIFLKREANHVYLAGSTDRSHYYAVITLLNQWGCRWYLPTGLGEVIPDRPKLEIEDLKMVYAPPFEVRNFWIAWNGSEEGAADFRLRNFMNEQKLKTHHTLKRYVKKVIPEGKTHFNIPLTAPESAEAIADEIDQAYAEGKLISLSMEDGVYRSDDPGDEAAVVNLHDKYFQSQSLTDAFALLYNRTAEILAQRHPESKAVLGFLAYINITIPPQREFKAAPSLVAEIAPIDIDPNHSIDDPRSPSRQEYGAMVRRWAEVMDKRFTIYDYDQGMLVWRDIPAPSHQVMQRDLQFYRDAGSLGVSTESRGAFATIFTNLFFRGQLMWNPDADVDHLLEEFYPAFYGPAAPAMKDYWSAIFKAWEDTVITEHEFYIIPAIYNPALISRLKRAIDDAKRLVEPLRGKADATRNEKLAVERVDIAALGFELMDAYTGMVFAGATEGDYAKAEKLGNQAVKVRLELAVANPTLTTRVIGPQADSKEATAKARAETLPGEVWQYANLKSLTDGTLGSLVQRLPLEWAFRRDPRDTGLARGFAGEKPDLAFWEENRERFSTPDQRKDYPTTQWEVVRTDLYAQAQGILFPDWQSFTGFLWYKTPVELSLADTKGKLHLHFPGLFGEAWLYVNGNLVAHRPQHPLWWKNSYRFDWDVDLSGKLKPGQNDITLRVHNTHHNGGIFRRPFLYQLK